MRPLGARLGTALGSLAALVATAFVVITNGESPLALLLFAGAFVSILGLEVGLRAAPVVVGAVFLLFGALLWSAGGFYAILCGALLIASAAVPRPDRAARERPQLG